MNAEKRRNATKAEFIHALAEYLSANLARRSIELEMGKEAAREWAKLRDHTPLFGWQTVEEAEKALTEFLS